MVAPGLQGKVFPSAPVPTGPGKRDRARSPLRVVVQVAWRDGQVPKTRRRASWRLGSGTV